jgi:hypothetical protein
MSRRPLASSRRPRIARVLHDRGPHHPRGVSKSLFTTSLQHLISTPDGLNLEDAGVHHVQDTVSSALGVP